MPKISGDVKGLREAKAAFKKAPEVFQTRLYGAALTTAAAMAQRARANLRANGSVESGALLAAIAHQGSPKTGQARVGLEKGHDTMVDGRLHQPTKIGHLVEFGHGGPHPAPPKPYMIPAAEAEREPYLARCRQAGKDAEIDIAQIGARNL